MEISMLALLRLCWRAVLLGGALAVLPYMVLLLRLILFPAEGELKLPRRLWLPSGAKRGFFSRLRVCPRIFGHISDFLVALTVAVSLLLFFFAENDGIPRLIAFVCVFFGASVFRKISAGPLRRVIHALSAAIRYLLLLSLYPFVKVGKAFLSFLGKAMQFLIKSIKRIYTIRTSHRYMRRAASRGIGKSLSSVLGRALDRYEGGRSEEH